MERTAKAVAVGLPALRVVAEEVVPSVYQATGTRVGEVTEGSAIIWTRLTAVKERNNEGLLIPGTMVDYRGKSLPVVSGSVDELEWACPAGVGWARVRFGLKADLSDAQATEWVQVTTENDGIHQFKIQGLKPGARYFYESEGKGKVGAGTERFRGEFETAPRMTEPSNLTFTVMTCQGYPDRGHPAGHEIYPSMLALKPAFTCLAGDLVYYDNDMPAATTGRLARYHWERMFSLPRLLEFNRAVSTYWLKDDHDTLKNDSWPGAKMGTLSFAEGQRIFREQAPLASGPTYRTFRWGRDLQIWFTEGRDYRSANTEEDGERKTIWGAEQKAWFERTLKASDATWKILISPTPLVGPDSDKKNDNHANGGFQHEGDELRAWLKANAPEHFFVICGDRHWQYHSVHPQSGVHEFSVGAASDEHATGSPGLDRNYHRFHSAKGGFLSTSVSRNGQSSRIRFQHHDVHGGVVYEWSAHRDLPT